MSSTPEYAVPENEIIEVHAEHLPVYCPGPLSPLWSLHPRVYIDTSKTGQASCPYCSATYRVVGTVSSH